ncbi:MAG: amino acid adenylation domain-containing protein [Candidatus Aminicenantes bacterium]|nr:MAG: amino acid adenylation domain-containing protein [Candidatus Aminicenantes bacterium]
MKKDTNADDLLIFNEGMIKEKDYWLQKLSNTTPTNIKLDYHRPESYPSKAAMKNVEYRISGEGYRKLMKLTGDEPFLLYAVLMASLNICLQKYTGSSSIVVGSPALRSNDDGANPTNVVTIVNDIDEGHSFREFLLKVRQTLLDAYERQNYPFERLLKDFGIEPGQNKCPFFDIALVLKNIHNDIPPVMNDITITLVKEGEEISGQVEFHGGLYRLEMIERFTRHFDNILTAALADTDIRISELQLVTEEERYQLLVEWNNTKVDYPREKCVHQLFEDHVQETPDAAALGFANHLLTYRQLNERANQVAHHLQSLGVGPDLLVGICIHRSLEMVIALLGILKAGGAYVPLDPTYPKERLTTMLEDARMEVLLTMERLLARLPEKTMKTICLDKDWEAILQESMEPPLKQATVRNLVYVIFTSGSTGRPKGAAIYHSGWTNLMNWFSKEFNINQCDRVLVVSSFSFDITQRSLAMPLINGAVLILVASDYYDPVLITQTIFLKQITLLNCSPSTFYPLIENTAPGTFQKLKSLRVLFLGGEAISASRLLHWVQAQECRTEIANVYGAAECTDVSSFYRLTDFERYIETSVPIGKPIFNSQVYVLDRNLNLVPVGIAGEICLAGDGVGKGYINDEALTTEKFVANPFSRNTNELLYRTGDLGRFLPEGTLEFIGRVDHQVKVRGFRIDLGDIETVLRQHPAVKEAVVIDREYSTGDQRLVAYVVPSLHQTLSHQETVSNKAKEESSSPQNTDDPNQEQLILHWQSFLKEKLPEYMVPNVFIVLEELPLNPNGKVDRDALPDPETQRKEEIEPPRTTLEEDLVALFAEFLKVDKNRIGIFDNFFELGGHSLLATQVIARVNERFQVQLTQVDLLVEPTVEGLAKRIEMNR